MDLYTKLKPLPVLNTLDLLSYIYEHQKDTCMKLNTISGFVFTGNIVNFSKTSVNAMGLNFQIIEGERITDRVICIDISRIESVELYINTENILSQGKLFPKEIYEASGKLEVKREVQKLHDEVLAKTTVSVGVPQFDLPEDGYVLNRYIKHFQLLKQTFLEVLAEADAQKLWKEKHTALKLIEAEDLDVKRIDKTVAIYYSFNKIDAPLINTKELSNKLMSIL